MIDRQPTDPPDLSDIWHDGPVAPEQEAPSPAAGRKARNRRPSPRAGRRWLPIAGYGALILACLSAATAAFLVIAAPIDLVRDRIIEQTKARTGRDLVIAGPTALSLFPHPAVTLSDVALSAPSDMEAPPTLVVPVVEAELRLWSLLTTQPVVDRITLHRPTIDLTVDAEGRRSWTGAGLRPHRLRTTMPATDETHAHDASLAPPPVGEPRSATVRSKVFAGSIRIVDGVVHYRDEASGSRADIEAINVTLAADEAAGPLNVDGSLTLRGAPLRITGTVAPAQALFADQPAELAVKISGAPFEGSYQGSLALAPGVSLDGTLKLQATSARALGDWLGRPPMATGDADAVAFSTDLKVTPVLIALSNLNAQFGAATTAGSLALDLKQERRRLSGNLEISELDFGRLLVKSARARARAPAPAAGAQEAAPSAATVAPAAAAPSTPAPPDKHGRDRGWSDDPFNLQMLSLLDVNLTLSAAKLLYKEVKTGPTRLSVTLEGGLGTVKLEDMVLYGGRGRGHLTLDGTGEVLVTGANLKLDGIALHPLLADALNFPWIEGRGNVSLALGGQGLSERQIVEALNGKVEIASADGAIAGLDIGKIVRGLQRGRLPSLTPSLEEKTPFSELTGTFTITNGIAKNQDLKLVSAHLQLAGEGTIHLGPRQIDYTMRTKIAGGQSEPGAVLKVGSVDIPISITGPWERPTFGIRGQEQLTGTIKQIGKNLKSQEVKDAIKGLLQGDGEKAVKPRDLIDKLLKKD